MKIAVLGANTEIGKKVVAKAEDAGIRVLSIISQFEQLKGSGQLMIKKVEELTFNDLKDCHYVVDPLSFLRISAFSSEMLPVWHMLEILNNSDVRLLLLGSVAILYTNSSRQMRVYEDGSNIIDEKQNKIDLLCVNAYKRLSIFKEVKWSLLCPPLLLDEVSYGNGHFEFGNDVLPVGLEGDSFISTNDFAASCVELLKMKPQPFTTYSVRSIKGSK
jgi:putative NADH-flavin reductase